MSQIRVTPLLALAALALLASNGYAQFIQPGMQGGTPDSGIQGRVFEDEDIPMCKGLPGGSHRRSNCGDEAIPTIEGTEENTFLIEIPVLPNRECSATTTTEYLQLNTIARVNSTLKITDCKSASGAFTIALRIRDESGEDKPLEFEATWQGSDDQDVTFAADYPIGEDVDLLSVRVRNLSCTCADPDDSLKSN